MSATRIHDLGLSDGDWNATSCISLGSVQNMSTWCKTRFLGHFCSFSLITFAGCHFYPPPPPLWGNCNKRRKRGFLPVRGIGGGDSVSIEKREGDTGRRGGGGGGVCRLPSPGRGSCRSWSSNKDHGLLRCAALHPGVGSSAATSSRWTARASTLPHPGCHSCAPHVSPLLPVSVTRPTQSEKGGQGGGGGGG